MGRTARVQFEGAKYHVMARGNWRAKIFNSSADYTRFLIQLRHALAQDQVTLYAFALMPNHYHLFVETPNANLSRFMQRLNTSYSLYFRHRTKRPGHCFQGRYAAQIVAGNDYCLRLTRYIHLNPINTKAMKKCSPAQKLAYLQNYEWSSYNGYVSAEHALPWVNYHWINEITRSRAAYARLINGFINDGAPPEDAIQDPADSTDIIPENSPTPIKIQLRLDQITAAVASAFDIHEKDIFAHGLHAAAAKATAIELACRHMQTTQSNIAKKFGYASETSIGKQRKRLQHLLSTIPDAQSRFNTAESLIAQQPIISLET